MPVKDPEKRKEQKKVWYEKNKERIKEQKKIYRQNNKEKIKEYKQTYNQTEQAKKSRRISDWKRSGVINDDYNQLYELYLSQTNCEECGIELTYDKPYAKATTKCLDHDHQSGEFRNILCHRCNVKRQ